MIKKNWFQPVQPKPVCLGTGLVALDIVINSDADSNPRMWAGGSCGNVLTILAFLGWESYPIARPGVDPAAGELIADIEKWKVKTTFVCKSRFGSTPIIVHKIGADYKGVPWHRFEWTCPQCGSWLPRYRPVPLKDIERKSKGLDDLSPQVFYFDRSSPAALELAKRTKETGTLVFFEPSGVGSRKVFSKCLEIADIVKYSHERMGHVQELTGKAAIQLEIETLGSEGARYKLSNGRGTPRWKDVKAYPVIQFKDSAGSGDWCSAGIIHLLSRSGVKAKVLTEKEVEDVLAFAQALAALNCSYEGARGLMYSVPKRRLDRLVSHVMQGRSPEISHEGLHQEKKVFELMCPRCRTGSRTDEQL